MSGDLVSMLAEAARDAVLARRGAIEAGGAGRLNSIVVEIEPANAGQVLTTSTYLGWKTTRRKTG